MTLEYESEVLFKLMERDGFNIPSSVPTYEADIKAHLINQVKQAYPKLTDYEAEWLWYNYTKHIPAEFPIRSVSNVTEATFENVVPFTYQSAILKGQTLVNTHIPVYSGCSAQSLVVENQWQVLTTKSNSYNLATYPCDLLKTNTKYLVIVDVKENTLATTWQGLNGHTSCVTNLAPVVLDYAPGETGKKTYIMTTKESFDGVTFGIRCNAQLDEPDGNMLKFRHMIIEYQDGMENWDIPYFEGMQSVQMPVLTTSNEDGTKTNILTVNEDVTLRSNGDVYDELNLLTGRLTQRIDENNEVLAQAVVKTVDLTVTDQDGDIESIIRPIEGTMHVSTSSQTLSPLLDMSVPVEATTQNLASFIGLEMEE